MDVNGFLNISIRLQGYALFCVVLLGFVCLSKHIEVTAVIRNSPVGKLWGEGKTIKPEDTALTAMMGSKLADFVFMLKTGIVLSAVLCIMSLGMTILGVVKHYPRTTLPEVFFMLELLMLILFIINFAAIKMKTNRLSEVFFDRHKMKELAAAAEEEVMSDQEGHPDEVERIKVINAETESGQRSFVLSLLFGGILAAFLAVAVSMVVVAILMMTYF